MTIADLAPPDTAPPRSADGIRFGMIVPSSNVTMERELPALLGRRGGLGPPGRPGPSGGQDGRQGERFSFHSSRVRMRSVTPEALAAMNAEAARATRELADAAVDLAVYACLVALMAEGPGAHRHAEARLGAILAAEGRPAPVVTSAGALVDTLHAMGARRIAVVAPYLPLLTQRVCDYVGAEGVEVVEAVSLSVADNGAVGRLDPNGLLGIAAGLPRDVDAVVLSACVQMPSLQVIALAEARLGLPVISTATATAFQALRRLGLPTRIPGAGRLLSGAFDAAPALPRGLAPAPVAIHAMAGAPAGTEA